MRWNDPSEWVWSTEIAHDPLVSVDEFEDVQRLIQAGTRPVERAKVNAPPQRKYLLRSRVRCGACRRRMGGTCDTARPTTCAGTANGNVAPEGHPNYAYVREDSVLSKLDLAALLGTLGDAVTAIETSDPDDKAVVYASLGLTV